MDGKHSRAKQYRWHTAGRSAERSIRHKSLEPVRRKRCLYCQARSCCRQIPAEEFCIYVSPAHNDPHGLSFKSRAKRIHQCSKCCASGRLCNELRRPEQQPHRIANPIIIDEHHLINEFPVQRKRIRLAPRRTKRISNGPYFVERLRRSFLETAIHRICAFRLDDVDACRRTHLLHRTCNSACESATTPSNNYRVESHARFTSLIDEFHADCRCAERGLGALVWMHERATLFGFDLSYFGKSFANAVDKYNVHSELTAHLHAKRVCGSRHHHFCTAAEHSG